MWNLVRILLVAFALTGFVGQTSARATPVQIFQEADADAVMSDCMQAMQDVDQPSKSMGDCSKGMTGDCMAKMGCTMVAPPITPPVAIAGPSPRRSATFGRVDVSREGRGPSPLHFPPKQQA